MSTIRLDSCSICLLALFYANSYYSLGMNTLIHTHTDFVEYQETMHNGQPQNSLMVLHYNEQTSITFYNVVKSSH